MHANKRDRLHTSLKSSLPNPKFNFSALIRNLGSLRRRAAFGLVITCRRSRVFFQPIRRSDQSRGEIAAAVRADEIEFGFDTILTKCAFQSANHRFS